MFRMSGIARSIINETTNQDVIKMFVTDEFPHSPEEMSKYGFGSTSRWKSEWGTQNLKLTQAPNGWVLLNYSTPLMFRDESGKVYVDMSRHSNSTSNVQSYIRGELESAGVEFEVADPNTMAQLTGLRSGRSVTGTQESSIREADVTDRDTDMVSDIRDTWNDPIEISQDVREFLMSMYENQVQDYELDDVIDAIERGIKEFREITNV